MDQLAQLICKGAPPSKGMFLESRHGKLRRDQVARLNEEASPMEKSFLTNLWAYDALPVGLTELTLLGSPGFKSSSCVTVLPATAVEPKYSVVSRGETQGRLLTRNAWGSLGSIFTSPVRFKRAQSSAQTK
jgi:hypothetical protein